ncbi:hypothetical protein QA639_21200 [Bradyrhizobium pachyrhizi]|uniref:hypothetical protein n=1 Tax=Bradyrhizobium pachyrhizi TaxID=280333 RepID=UPI0024B04269|nr:hypothetical protein [Bradyrhizobium pachyrhizi]WFU52227.1 hypothetical protein QA639_21200 [Bradyrhizobium pachyrhizi]
MSNSDLDMLKAMLSHRRPYGSKTELAYIDRFITPLGVQADKFGNRFVIVGEEKPSILWSSHTDSVHREEGFQQIEMTGTKIHLPKKSKSNCLGADDAAGNFIMIKMIEAKVPGLYVFHFGEEVGCKGSGGIANETPEFLDGIKAAIAFDRRGFTSVITHQRGRTASDAFGDSLAAQLPDRFKNDPTGVLTDTKIYMGIVPECSNVSVGYENEHTKDETQCVQHLFQLRDHMIKIDASKFVIERDPKGVQSEPPKRSSWSGSSSGFGSTSRTLRTLQRMRQRDLEDLVFRYPRQVAAYLEEIKVSVQELDDAIWLSNSRARRESTLLDLFDDEGFHAA